MTKVRVAGVVAAGFLAVVCGWRLSAQPPSEPSLVAHEWGTFTALQDDDGSALGSINSDDEPVPDFVHGAGPAQALTSLANLSPLLNNLRSKGFVRCHPDVTMRLETPVIYLYPTAKGRPATADVHVQFHGGWLSEFYPQAKFTSPDRDDSYFGFAPTKLTAATTSSLDWNHVILGAPGEPMATDDPVWTTPREVPRAAMLGVEPTADDTTPTDPPEKFLFYRGVGHVASPLRVVRDAKTDRLSIHADGSALAAIPAAGMTTDLIVPSAWLIEIRPGDGFCAFRPVPGPLDLHTPANQVMAALPASFAAREFGAARLGELRASMQAALVLEGLYPDEAAAMLKTWELSYFQSPGRRLFFITPRPWTDRVLPLSIDGAAVTRAMMGRIELITPAQRERLARLAAGPCPDMGALAKAYEEARSTVSESAKQAAERIARHGRWHPLTIAESGVAVPALYQDYMDLGRFRDALVLREERQRSTPALEKFVKLNLLGLVDRGGQPLDAAELNNR